MLCGSHKHHWRRHASHWQCYRITLNFSNVNFTFGFLVSSRISAARSPSSSPSPASTSASSLSTGDKAAIGVAAPSGGIIIVGILFLIYRKSEKSKTETRGEGSPDADFEKPELMGGPYDPTIAGPVRPKPGLDPNSQNRSELPLDRSHQLSTANERATSIELYTSTDEATTSGQALAVRSVSTITRKPVPLPVRAAPIVSPTPQPQKLDNHNEFTEEYDTLVSEMGIISKRQKALTAAAATAGVRPEDLQGRKGEDYRELARRQSRLRGRMAELQDTLEIGRR